MGKAPGSEYVSERAETKSRNAGKLVAPSIGTFNRLKVISSSVQVAVPKRVFDQLAARRASWPIPWTAEDLKTPWLAPERLLLYVQIAEPDDKWEATLRIDGRPVALEKAYSAVRAEPSTFVGFYAELFSQLASVPQAHSWA